ncbi:MAG: hypothetical protein RBT80_28385, partial [Candidatus Vecturithrix sp.]|nr:hypothetical protein [Candidatus Vecturithrix sp.]
MTETPGDLFELLKRKKSILTKKPTLTTVFFCLNLDEVGAYLRVVDDQGNLLDASYEYYSGVTRDILKSLDAIQEKNSFRIDWEKPADRIYLAEHEYLLWQLQHCEHFVDAQFQPIRFAEGDAKVSIAITPREDVLHSAIVLIHQGVKIAPIQLLTENFAFADHIIYRIQPLGENFQELSLFENKVLSGNLEKYLSLLYTFFENIIVSYQHYRQIEGPPKHTQPALIFEKVDVEHSLYLRVSTTLSGFDADFFDDYEIAKVVTLNDLEKTLMVSDVLHEEIYSCFQEIEKLLRKHKRGLEQRNDYHIEDNLFMIEEELAKEFIYKELTNLITRFAVFGAEKLKSYKVRAVTPTLHLNLSHGIDFLEGEATLDIAGQTISLFEALNHFRKHAYIPLNDGTHAIINKQYIEKLTRIFKKQKDNVKVSFFDLPIIEELIGENIAQSTFPQSRE